MTTEDGEPPTYDELYSAVEGGLARETMAGIIISSLVNEIASLRRILMRRDEEPNLPGSTPPAGKPPLTVVN